MNHKVPTLPKFLYKYRSGDARSVSMLEMRKAWIPDFYNLNDIFEADFEFELATALEHTNVFYPEIIKDEFGEPTFAPMMLSRKLTDEEAEAHRAEILKKIDEVRKAIFSKGVYCLASSCTNQLMWSHYADSHRGFCIEYRIPPEWPSQGRMHLLPRGVEYMPAPHPIEWTLVAHYPLGLLEYYMIGNKHIDWSYEAEYRLVYPNGEQDVDMPFRVESIIFGERAQAALINGVRKAVGDDVKLKKLVKKRGTYGLDVQDL